MLPFPVLPIRNPAVGIQGGRHTRRNSEPPLGFLGERWPLRQMFIYCVFIGLALSELRSTYSPAGFVAESHTIAYLRLMAFALCYHLPVYLSYSCLSPIGYVLAQPLNTTACWLLSKLNYLALRSWVVARQTDVGRSGSFEGTFPPRYYRPSGFLLLQWGSPPHILFYITLIHGVIYAPTRLE